MQIIPMVTRIIKSNVKYRGLGGKKIVIDRELTREDILHTDNWTCWNFIDRRPEVKDVWKKHRYFYGHAEDNLGYVVCDDELESEVPKIESDKNGV